MTQSPKNLQETIALLEATLEATHDGILVVSLDGKVILYNRQYLKMFGFTAEALERGGADGIIAALIPQLQDGPTLRVTFDALANDPELEALDVLRFKDGRIFERFVAPHRVGATIVGRVASFRDVGESTRAAEAVEQHRAMLEKAQAVAHIGSWVAELDATAQLSWSAELHRIFDVPIGQFGGTTETFFELVHKDDLAAVRAATAAAIAGGPPYDIEHRVKLKDGSIRWVHEKADIIRDAEGRARQMIGTAQDITARRQLEDQLRQSQKMEAIGRLAGGIAHDMNNALTAIAGYAELALNEMAPDHKARPDVEEIRRAAERAGSVTRQLLAFSRKQMLEPRVFNLNETVANIGRLIGRLLGADIEVRTHAAESPLYVFGDPGQVEQAIMNLAVNARDAMPVGGRFELRTSLDDVDEAFARAHVPIAPGRYVCLRVSDTGHGMSRETSARIFEPFFTTKDVGKGTGLGLSMVYGTLKQIGGLIFVDSEIDRGTTFSLYFSQANARTATAAPPAPSAEQAARRGHETLLVVEDEPAVRKLVAMALRQDGYTLLVASSAEEALVTADACTGPIDLLLTDASMPGKSGIELAVLLGARRPGLPVLVMSGYTEEALTGGRGEPIALLQKPFTPHELRRRVREMLDRQM
ncbi:MAG: hypothetical protein A3F69_05685 [Acidobacteria bacterium RIFCSPLOWO2_12_FULL_66_10]|nr:MAG: hypothetical protein A3F69_05685 [Acidobacteria bacterium RIFCSPLOWO2_12_FULL_66_10]